MASVQMDSAIANISAFVAIFIICLLATLIIAAIYKKEQPQSIPTKEEIDAFLNEDNEEVK
jgi:Na+/melibiose symporter-like transporter